MHYIAFDFHFSKILKKTESESEKKICAVIRDVHTTYRVLQTIQMKLILLCVVAEPAVLGSTKSALKFKFEIQIG